MPKPVDIPFPVRGLSETLASDMQNPTTTQASQNMRAVDPASGRIRGGQRSGIRKYISTKAFDSFVQEMVQVTIDSNLTTYTVREAAPSVEWSKTVNGKDAVTDIAVTRGGDVFTATPPDKVSKYTSEGSWQHTTQVPTSSESEYISAVEVDSLDNVYVAVRTGGASRYGGRVIKYVQTEDGLDEAWRVTLDAAQPVDISVQGDRLAVLTREDKGGELIVYTSLGASTPDVLWRRAVPTNGVGVAFNDDGDVFACFDEDPTRGDDDETECGVTSVSWNPRNISTDNLWAWYDATQMNGYTDRQDVDLVPDWSGNLRDLFAAPQGWGVIEFPGSWGVKYVTNSFCGHPGFRFTAARRDGKVCGLAAGNGDLNAFPINRNNPFAVIMLLKSMGKGGDGDAKLFETLKGSGYTAFRQTTNGIGLNLEFVDCGQDDLDNPGNAAYTAQANILNAGEGRTGAEGVCIVSFGWSPLANDGFAGYSFFRVNGETIDAFTLDHYSTPLGVHFGHSVFAGEAEDWGHFYGDLLEMIVLKGRYNLPTGGTQDQDPTGTFTWPDTGSPLGYTSGPELILLCEGYLAHKYGQQAKLHQNHIYKSSPPPQWPSGTSPPDGDDQTEARKLDSKFEIVAKFGSGSGTLRWAFEGHGYGYGVAVRDEWVYTIGRHEPKPSPDWQVTLRRIKDEGYTADDAGTGTYELTLTQPKTASTTGEDDIHPVRMAVDSDHNLYVPVKSSDTVNDSYSIRKIKSDGTVEWNYKVPILNTPSPTPDHAWGRVVALDTISDIPEREGIGEPEFLYLGVDLDTPGDDSETLFKLRLVDATVDLGATREKRIIGMGNGVFKKIVKGATMEVTVLTNNGDTPSSTARVVQGAVLNEDAFFVDGRSAWVYKGETDEVDRWTAENGGTLPKRPRLIEAWRGRLVVGRCEGEPGNLYMSKVGDPFDWDLYPPVISAVQAVSLEVSPAGQVPDIVNGIIPYSDDLLIILCDHSIWRLTGDPMAGGRLDMISKSVGGAYGRAWCMDDVGVIYFYGSRGGLYRMIPGRWTPEPLSQNRLDRKLDSLSLDFFTVKMAWNDKDRTVHMFTVPIDTVTASPSPGGDSGPQPPGGWPAPGPGEVPKEPDDGADHPGGDFGESGYTGYPGSPPANAGGWLTHVNQRITPPTSTLDYYPLPHYVWERPTDAFWEDMFAHYDLDPTAVLVVDGDDPDDRVLLMGCADGYLRHWDRYYKNDDDRLINAWVVIGPLRPQEAHAQVRWNDWEITLANELDGATASWFASENAGQEGPELKTFTLSAGRNSGIKKRVKGSYVWLKLKNETFNESFAVEEMAAQWHLAGRTR